MEEKFNSVNVLCAVNTIMAMAMAWGLFLVGLLLYGLAGHILNENVITTKPATSESKTEDIQVNTDKYEDLNVRYTGVIFDSSVASSLGYYSDTIEKYSLDVLDKYGCETAYVYDCCFDESYSGYSVHILFDDIRYQCIWVNPDNLGCVVLYDCDLTNPVIRRGFY